MGQKERAALLSPDIVMDVDTVCRTADSVGGRGRSASEPLGAHNAWVWVWGCGGAF